jgi:hypothetical protein
VLASGSLIADELMGFADTSLGVRYGFDEGIDLSLFTGE